MGRILPLSVSRREKKKKLRVRRGVFFATFVFFVFIFVYLLLWRSGFWLIQDDSFDHVPWVFVLDGQGADLERTRFAGNLILEGKADSVLIFGRRAFWDKNNADFYAEDLMRMGEIDGSRVFLFRHDDPSTIEEAYSSIPWLKERNIDTVLLITSAAATKRVKNLFTTLTGDSVVFLTCDIRHYIYNPENWAFERESRKIWLKEWAALLYSKWDLLWADLIKNSHGRIYPVLSLEESESLPSVPVLDVQKLDIVSPDPIEVFIPPPADTSVSDSIISE